MDLNFLGRGGAFNPKEGNTSAYFIENNELFLIDCGETVFEALINNNILDGIETINVMITHTHSDHIGSIGSLAFYSYYMLHKPLNIILPKEAKHQYSIEIILRAFGCFKETYNIICEEAFDNKYYSFNNIRYLETRHCDELDSYSILFNTKEGVVFFSGDTNDLDNLKKIINSKQTIDKIYIDSTTLNYPTNGHMYIGFLNEIIPDELRRHVYCMHINNDDCIIEAKSYGFNVVEINHPFVKKLK